MRGTLGVWLKVERKEKRVDGGSIQGDARVVAVRQF